MFQTPPPALPGAKTHGATWDPARAFPSVYHCQHQEQQLQVSHEMVCTWDSKAERPRTTFAPGSGCLPTGLFPLPSHQLLVDSRLPAAEYFRENFLDRRGYRCDCHNDKLPAFLQHQYKRAAKPQLCRTDCCSCQDQSRQPILGDLIPRSIFRVGLTALKVVTGEDVSKLRQRL